MNARIATLGLLAGIGCVLTLPAAPAAHADSPIVAVVNGGGIAVFDDPRFEGMTTPFAVGVTIRSDGSAKGHFECVMTGILANSVQITSGSLNADGSVTFSGIGMETFAGAGPFLFGWETATVTAGGPGVGTFCLGPPTYLDTLCDHETVVHGLFSIKTH